MNNQAKQEKQEKQKAFTTTTKNNNNQDFKSIVFGWQEKAYGAGELFCISIGFTRRFGCWYGLLQGFLKFYLNFHCPKQLWSLNENSQKTGASNGSRKKWNVEQNGVRTIAQVSFTGVTCQVFRLLLQLCTRVILFWTCGSATAIDCRPRVVYVPVYLIKNQITLKIFFLSLLMVTVLMQTFLISCGSLSSAILGQICRKTVQKIMWFLLSAFSLTFLAMSITLMHRNCGAWLHS